MIQIDDLQAGRELDALVAEKVMGIKCGACLQDGQLEPITMDWQEIPHYSTDIAAAWKLIENLRDEYKLLAMLVELPGGWFANFSHAPAKYDTAAEAAPLAICRAALKAMEQ